MNRIYKVIWNKARGMYVVVSELAKNHTKSSGSTVGSRKGVRLLSAVAAAVVMSLSGGFMAEAADGHTSVVIGPKGGNLTVGKQTNADGGTEYVLGMKDDIAEKTVTATQALKASDGTNSVTATSNGNLDATGTVQAGRVLDKSTTDGTVISAANGVGANLNALDTAVAGKADSAALAQEIVDRKTADASQDARINEAADNLSTLNQNVVDGFTAINKNVADGFTSLNATDAANAQAIADEAAAREAADKELQVKANNASASIATLREKKADKADVEAADTALDQKISQEIADRKGADASQDARINEAAANLSTLNQNVADGFTAINQNVADGFTAINAVNDAQQAQIDAATAEASKHNTVHLGNEAQGGGNLTLAKGTNKDGGTDYVLGLAQDIQLDTVSAKETVTTGDGTNYVTATSNGNLDATGTVQAGRVLDKSTTDGTVVSAANSVGQNLNALDAAVDTKADQTALDEEKAAREAADTALDQKLGQEIADRKGADASQDKRINEVADNLSTLNQNVADGFTTINQNVADGFAALSAADAANAQAVTDEAAAREAADTALDQKLGQEIADRKGADLSQDKRINETAENLSQLNQNVVDGFNTINTNVANGFNAINAVNAAQQQELDTHAKAIDGTLKLDENGVLQQQTYDETTKTFSDADVSSVTVKGDVTATGTVKANVVEGTKLTDKSGAWITGGVVHGKTITDDKGASMSNGVVTGKTLTDGTATITNGNLDTTGNVNAGNVTATDTVTGKTLTDGVLTITEGNITDAKDITASGTITGGTLHSTGDV